MKHLYLLIPALALVAAASALGLCIALGGPTSPPPMASINDPFRSVDFSELPTSSWFRAEDGQALAYREYGPVGQARGSVTLVHGSSASSNSMHPLAKALASSGYKVYALDIRGHGQSGPKGHIQYVGQLESDLAAFVRNVQPMQPATLAGFSSGGGFVLRFAGSHHGKAFGSYLLLSPFLSQDAPNQRPGSGGWVAVGVPRFVALSILNSIGIRGFNFLPVTAFALSEDARTALTPQYDFNLTANFRPEPDYMANIARVTQPVAAIAGASDEAFIADKLEGVFRAAGKNWEVELLPNVGHVALTLEPSAIAAVVRRVGGLQAAGQ